jgi:WD40 repeat protein
MRMPPQRLKGPQQQQDKPCVSKPAKKRASAVVSRTIASGLRLALRFPVDVGDLHLAADGKTIALCLEDKSVRVFDVASGNQVGVYTFFVSQTAYGHVAKLCVSDTCYCIAVPSVYCRCCS